MNRLLLYRPVHNELFRPHIFVFYFAGDGLLNFILRGLISRKLNRLSFEVKLTA